MIKFKYDKQFVEDILEAAREFHGMSNETDQLSIARDPVYDGDLLGDLCYQQIEEDFIKYIVTAVEGNFKRGGKIIFNS